MTWKRVVAGLPLLAVLGLIGSPEPARAQTAGDPAARLGACMLRNLPERSSRQQVRFRRVDRLGAARVLQAEMLWRRFPEGARARVRFLAPAELRGASLLLAPGASAPRALVWLPELGEVRGLEEAGLDRSLFGTDFSLGDLERLLLGHGRGQVVVDAEARLDGREVSVLQSDAPGELYERVITHVDRERCVPLRVELFDASGRLRKVMTLPIRRIERRGSRWIPTLVLMKDLQMETHTELIVDAVALDLDLAQTLFHEAALPGPTGGSP